jgi:K+-dependent Na+/Ca+ exchanger-like protein
MVILYILGLVIIFYLLAKICDQYFVSSLDVISKKLRLSEDVAGATLMAIGSSAPEFFTAVFAIFKAGSEQVGAGTIVGSAIFNILVIVGASALVATAYLNWRPVIRDLLFYSLSIVLLLFTFKDGSISLIESFLYVLLYSIYIIILVNWQRISGIKEHKNELEDISEALEQNEKQLKKSKHFLMRYEYYVDSVLASTFPKNTTKSYLQIFSISIFYIIILSWALVELAVLTAHQLGIPEVIIALTVLAAGTSIPDLLSSVIVAKQGRGDMAVSNAVGSNVFDILIGLGLPWFFYILITGKTMSVATENLISSIVLLFFTVITLLFLLLLRKFKISQRAGGGLIILYILFVIYSIGSVYYPNIFSFEIIKSMLF